MRIIFHIGAGKTGSSAIQHALATNQSELIREGIFLPSEDLTTNGKVTGYHVWWFENVKQMESCKALEEVSSKLSSVITEAEEKSCDTVLFSAENLSNPFSWSGLLKQVLHGHDVSVLMYIRRQDEYLLSAWQQWGIKTGSRLEEWLFKNIGTTGDWSVPIKEWQTIATDKLMVRVYQRERLCNGDVVDDFFDTIGIDASEFTKSKKNVNSSYNIAVEELALAAPALFEGAHDNQFFNMVQQYGIDAHKKAKGESRLSGTERRSIIDRYQTSNQWIKSEYFGDLAGPLFDMPGEKEYRVLTPSEIETKKWALVAELVYGMHKQLS